MRTVMTIAVQKIYYTFEQKDEKEYIYKMARTEETRRLISPLKNATKNKKGR